MVPPKIFAPTALLATAVAAYDTFLQFPFTPEVETRTLDEIHQATLAEGGVVTLWHGGDEKNQQDALKAAFEECFPSMTLNVTADASKYHDGNVDQHLSGGNVYVDSFILQAVQDYPRWDQEGALLRYKPLNFDKIHPQFRDTWGSWYAFAVFGWSNVWNTEKLANGPVDYSDFLKPEFKDKLVFTYPNDDDAVLFAFDLAVWENGYSWFEQLSSPNGLAGIYAASFGTAVGLLPPSSFNISFPENGFFVTRAWGQRGAILKDAPLPEGAKLLHNFLLSDELQDPANTGRWSVRQDLTPPVGYPALWKVSNINANEFDRFMADRTCVERLKLFYENLIGTPQGLIP